MNTQTINKQQETKPATQYISGSEAVLKCILQQGIDTIFGYPGGAIMPIYDALYSYQDKITHILGQGCLQEVDRVANIVFIVFQRIRHRFSNIGVGRKMDHAINPVALEAVF